MSSVERTIYKQTYLHLRTGASLLTVPFLIFLPPFNLPPVGIQWEQGKNSSVNMVNRRPAVPEWAKEGLDEAGTVSEAPGQYFYRARPTLLSPRCGAGKDLPQAET